MANFQPLKKHMFRYLDHILQTYSFSSPFLDIGCGVGDVSEHLAQNGFTGSAIDSSEIAITQAQKRLKNHPNISVKNQSLYETTGAYRFAILWDVLEHLEDDLSALNAVARLLETGGYLIVSIPSNPKEWRWDDEFYGHYRRYPPEEIIQKLQQAGFQTRVIWDFTFPHFWILRRIYTSIKRNSTDNSKKLQLRTAESATVNSWDLPFISTMFDSNNFFWQTLGYLQFRFFRNYTRNGHELLILAQKTNYA